MKDYYKSVTELLWIINLGLMVMAELLDLLPKKGRSKY